MSDRIERVSAALLDLGLEDWIPIPEAVGDPVVAEATLGEDPSELVADALAALVAEDRVRLYRGRWDEDPAAVPAAEALELLRDPRWYSFRVDDPNEERLFFVNVRNIGAS